MQLSHLYNIAKAYVHRWMLQNKYYNWYVFSRHLSDLWQKEVEKHYTGKHTERNKTYAGSHHKTVIAIFNGWVESGGWADRLKGILSTYLLCKENGWDFKLYYVHPFRLETYLTPGTYDWRIADDGVHFDFSKARPIALEIGSDSPYQAKKQKEWLRRQIEQAPTEQVHVYTNAMFAYTDNYGQAFHELFTTTDRLEKRIQECMELLSPPYISISARFLNSLGDFCDTMLVEPLPPDKRKLLIDGCMQQIERIHKLHPGMTLLINSDSQAFLRLTDSLPYAIHINGNIVHFDTVQQNSDYDAFEKTFIDFFLISRAQGVYRLRTQWMHKTGFPYAASRINDVSFFSIDFRLQQTSDTKTTKQEKN